MYDNIVLFLIVNQSERLTFNRFLIFPKFPKNVSYSTYQLQGVFETFSSKNCRFIELIAFSKSIVKIMFSLGSGFLSDNGTHVKNEEL